MTQFVPVVHSADFARSAVRHHPLTAAFTAGKALFAKFYDALLAANQRQAQRDIERFVSTKGGRLTDSLEREISSYILKDGASGWSRRT